MRDTSVREPLRIPERHWQTIAERVREGVPLEVCGLLGGVGRVVRGVFPLENIAPDPAIGYYAEPEMLLQALRALDERGWELVGIYHSHPPGSRPDPSPTDIAQVSYPGIVHLIVLPTADGHVESRRGFLLGRGSDPVEVAVAVEAEDGAPD